MPGRLDGKTVAVLATDGFEQVELLEPRKALEQAGARVEVVSNKSGQIQGFNHFDRGETVAVDRTLGQADPRVFDALLIPGGAWSPDQLRILPETHLFVRAFFDADKPVAAICHGPWILIDAGVVDGRTVTSYRTIRQDLRNAGARVIEQEVVVDDGLVTSRQPSDIPAFIEAMIEEFAEGRRERRRAAVEREDDRQRRLPDLM